jgi:hypothetical protein
MKIWYIIIVWRWANSLIQSKDNFTYFYRRNLYSGITFLICLNLYININGLLCEDNWIYFSIRMVYYYLLKYISIPTVLVIILLDLTYDICKVADLRHVVFSLLRLKMRKHEGTAKLNFVVSSCFAFSRQQSVNTTEGGRKYDTKNLSYFRYFRIQNTKMWKHKETTKYFRLFA